MIKMIRQMPRHILALLCAASVILQLPLPVQGETVSQPDVSAYLPNNEDMTGRLASLERIHPRIYLDESNWAALKTRVQQPAYIEKNQNLRDAADRAAKMEFTYTSGQPDADEVQREIGDNLALFAAAYRLTGKTEYLTAAETWCLNAANLSVWGSAGNDLAAGHILYGMALCYDWLYHDFSADTRAVIQTALAEKGQVMYEAFSNRKKSWTTEYLQNHGWINLTGLSAAAAAIYDQYSTSILWLEDAAAFFANTFSLLPEDGASQEGIGYWSYGAEWLIKYADLACDFTGVNPYQTNWMKNTGYYRLYLSNPCAGWGKRSSSAMMADAHGYDFNGAHHILYRLAAQYNDGYYQYLADRLEAADYGWGDTTASWAALLWYDPQIRAVSPVDLAPGKVFEDMGIAALHSGWSDTDSALYLRCGPYLGHTATRASQLYSQHDLGGGHVHPDNNSFILHSGNEVLIRDDGYTKKATSNHNTLLIDGQGQLGEGNTWFNQDDDIALAYAFPAIQASVLTDTVDYIAADAQQAYDPVNGLTKFRRHFIYLKPNALVIIDEIETDRAANLELRFFPQYQSISEIPGGFDITGGKDRLHITSLSNDTVMANESVPVYTDRYGATESRNVITVKKAQAQSLFAVTALSWSPYWQTPEAISAVQDGRQITITKGNTQCTIDLETMTLRLFSDSAEPIIYTADGTAVTNGCTISRETSGFTVQQACASSNSEHAFSLEGPTGSVPLRIQQTAASASTDLLLLAPLNPGEYTLTACGKQIMFSVSPTFASSVNYDFSDSVYILGTDMTESPPPGWTIADGGGTAVIGTRNGSKCLLMSGADTGYTTPVADIPLNARTEPFSLTYTFSAGVNSPQPYFELYCGRERRLRLASPWRSFAVVTGYEDSGAEEEVFCNLFGMDANAFKIANSGTYTVTLTVDPVAGFADLMLVSDRLAGYTGPHDPRVIITGNTAALHHIPLTGASIGVDRLRIGMVPNGEEAYQLGINNISIAPIIRNEETFSSIYMTDTAGREITDLRGDETAWITAIIKNANTTAIHAALYLASYTATGQLDQVKQQQILVEPDEWKAFSIPTGNIPVPDGGTLSVYLWKQPLQPIALPFRAIHIPAQNDGKD